MLDNADRVVIIVFILGFQLERKVLMMTVVRSEAEEMFDRGIYSNFNLIRVPAFLMNHQKIWTKFPVTNICYKIETQNTYT
jgi:hypothetical protein